MERVDRPPLGCDPSAVGPERTHREQGTRDEINREEQQRRALVSLRERMAEVFRRMDVVRARCRP